MSRQVGDYHDVIDQVAANYHFPPTPQFLVDLQELLSAFLRAVAEFLQRFLGFARVKEINSVGASDLLKVALIILGVISFVILLFVAVRRLSALSAQSRRANGASLFNQPLNADEWRNQALRSAGEGDYRTACRALYMSSLRRLDEKGVIAFNSARTNFEYYLALHAHKDLQAPFRALANIFDVLWFGDRNADQAEFDRSLEYLDELEKGMNASPANSKGSANG